MFANRKSALLTASVLFGLFASRFAVVTPVVHNAPASTEELGIIISACGDEQSSKGVRSGAHHYQMTDMAPYDQRSSMPAVCEMMSSSA